MKNKQVRTAQNSFGQNTFKSFFFFFFYMTDRTIVDQEIYIFWSTTKEEQDQAPIISLLKSNTT